MVQDFGDPIERPSYLGTGEYILYIYIYMCYTGIMEKKMETTTFYQGKPRHLALKDLGTSSTLGDQLSSIIYTHDSPSILALPLDSGP